MNTIIKSSNGISLVPIESRLLTDRKVFIEGVIDTKLACDFEKCVMLLLKEDAEKPIDVYISSPGGEIAAGNHILDTLKGIKAEVNLYGRGIVASMAAIILASGRKNHRFVTPGAEIMIHEPLLSGGVGGSASSIERTAENIIKKKAKAVELLANSTGRSKKEIEKAISYDHFFTAEEAVNFGLVDSIKTTIV